MATRRKRVVVVGAGMSGLAAASKLLEEEDLRRGDQVDQLDVDVTVLEASSYVGGRILVDHHWHDIDPVDMGGEFVHGEDSMPMKIAEEQGWKSHKICVNSMAMSRDRAVYLRGELIDLWDTNVEHMEEALNAWESIKNCGWRANQTIKHRLSRPDGERVQIEDVEDCSIAQACKALGVSEEAKLILRAVIAQTDGGCWDDFGLADFCEDWPYGEINSRYDKSYSVLLAHYLKSIHTNGGNVLLSSPVYAIETIQDSSGVTGTVVRYHSSNGKEDTAIACDYVIATVPLTILQKRTISFEPELPKRMQHAIDSLPMHAAIKIYIRFSCRFWPARLHIWYCTSGVLSQYWPNLRRKTDCYSRLSGEDLDDHPYASLIEGTGQGGFVTAVRRSDVCGLNGLQTVQDDDSQDVQLLCGFATADVAKRASQLDAVSLIQESISQLDGIFGSEDANGGAETVATRPASRYFDSALVCNWSKHPYVMGGYSAPAVGGVTLRPCLAEPAHGGRLYFAGEATHCQPSSVQAAIETGLRAASSVQDSIHQRTNDMEMI